MPPSAVLQTLADIWPVLQNSGIPSAIAGGVALSYWGNPRSTQDIDIAVLTSDCEPISSALKGAGFTAKSERPIQLGVFELSEWSYDPVDEYVTVEVDLLMGTSDYYKAAFSRVRPIELEGVAGPLNVLSREDLILLKLYAGRLIDQADVATLLEIHWSDLNQSYLETWAENLGLQNELRAAIQAYREKLN